MGGIFSSLFGRRGRDYAPSVATEALLAPQQLSDEGLLQLLPTSSLGLVSCGYDCDVRCASQTWTHPSPVNRVCLGSSSQLLSGCMDGKVRRLFEDKTPGMDILWDHGMSVTALTPCPGDLVFSGSRNAVTRFSDLSSDGNAVWEAQILRNVVTHSCAVPGGQFVCQASEDLLLRIWDHRVPPPSGEEVRGAALSSQTLSGVVNAVCAVDQHVLAVGFRGFSQEDGAVVALWDVRKPDEVAPLYTQGVSVTGVCTNGDLVYSCGADGVVRRCRVGGTAEDVAILPTAAEPFQPLSIAIDVDAVNLLVGDSLGRLFSLPL